VPQLPQSLAPWEKSLSTFTHRAVYVLLILVPLMGYSMSSTLTQSDGVPFFFIAHVPELLPKTDRWFEVFQPLHRILAYALLTLVSFTWPAPSSIASWTNTRMPTCCGAWCSSCRFRLPAGAPSHLPSPCHQIGHRSPITLQTKY
jgi:hypothetical protein